MIARLYRGQKEGVSSKVCTTLGEASPSSFSISASPGRSVTLLLFSIWLFISPFPFLSSDRRRLLVAFGSGPYTRFVGVESTPCRSWILSGGTDLPNFDNISEQGYLAILPTNKWMCENDNWPSILMYIHKSLSPFAVPLFFHSSIETTVIWILNEVALYVPYFNFRYKFDCFHGKLLQWKTNQILQRQYNTTMGLRVALFIVKATNKHA